MKQNLKLLTAFLCGAVFFSGISFAATGELKALVSDYKVKLQGSIIKTKSKIITISGEHYIAAKDVATLTGKQLTIDKNSKTIRFDEVKKNVTTVKPDDSASNFKINIPDAALNKIIRKMINKPNGEIFYNDIKNITGIYQEGDGIKSLEGLQYFKKVKELQLPRASLENITALSKMPQLTFVDLYECNISDISSLKGLVNLKSLNLAKNKISDLTPLAGLKNLEYLTLADNNVSDLSPLKGLTKLETLTVGNNPITDITALKNLKNINNKSNSDNSLMFSNGNIFYRIPYSMSVIKINDKKYLLEGLHLPGFVVDVNNKLYTERDIQLVNYLLNLKSQDYTFIENNNPYLDGTIKFNNFKQYIEAETKYINATETYWVGTIYNLDRTVSYSLQYKKGDIQGFIPINEYTYLFPLSDVLEKFKIKFNVGFDKENKLNIISLD